jgi:hypothetical protein
MFQVLVLRLEAVDLVVILRLHRDIVIRRKAAMIPAVQHFDTFVREQSFGFQQGDNLAPEQKLGSPYPNEDGLDVGYRHPRVVSIPATPRHDGMNVRIPFQQVSRRLDDRHHAGAEASAPTHSLDHELLNRFEAGAREEKLDSDALGSGDEEKKRAAKSILEELFELLREDSIHLTKTALGGATRYAEICRRRRLGGLLNYYYREAARRLSRVFAPYGLIADGDPASLS